MREQKKRTYASVFWWLIDMWHAFAIFAHTYKLTYQVGNMLFSIALAFAKKLRDFHKNTQQLFSNQVWQTLTWLGLHEREDGNERKLVLFLSNPFSCSPIGDCITKKGLNSSPAWEGRSCQCQSSCRSALGTLSRANATFVSQSSIIWASAKNSLQEIYLKVLLSVH